MVRPWYMEQDFIMIPGMAGIIIPVPGPGASICVTAPGPDGASAMASEAAGSISASALAMPVIGADADGAAVAGGARTSIVLRMYGIAPARTAITAVIFTATGM